jgi:hypothetical protein
MKKKSKEIEQEIMKKLKYQKYIQTKDLIEEGYTLKEIKEANRGYDSEWTFTSGVSKKKLKIPSNLVLIERRY